MASNQDLRKSSVWALLIGVNHYLHGEKNLRPVFYNDLSGCVPDVDSIKGYLGQMEAEHITTLTSTKKKDADGPKEPDSQLPKYTNVIRELEKIIQDSKVGDIVYIHYSGHGIQRKGLSDKECSGVKGDGISGTALAMADVMVGGAYLTGKHLEIYIRRMVQKKLRVTVILDSCFSGRGLRSAEIFDGYASRHGDSDSDGSFLKSDNDAQEAIATYERELEKDSTRGVTKVRSWWSDPTGCTVLTACDFDETAGEYVFEGGKHGILTYWMLELLSQSQTEGRRPTYTEIKHYVEQKIKDCKRPRKNQTPVLHGDSNYVFLGLQQVTEKPVGHTVRPSALKDTIVLDIGWAHSVASGAIYDVYLRGEAIGSVSKYEAEITDVPHDQPFQSKAVLRSRTPGQPIPSLKELAASRVILRTWSLPTDVYVDSSLLKEHISAPHMKSLLNKIQETAGLLPTSDDSPAKPSTFKISPSTGNAYLEILEGTKKIPRFPTVPVDSKGLWTSKIAYLLSHKARFEALRSFGNENIEQPLDPKWFSFTATPLSPNYDDEDDYYSDYGSASGTDLDDNFEKVSEDTYRVIEDTLLRCEFSIKPECKYDSVYISVYGFSASWGISKLHPGEGQTCIKVDKKTPQAFGFQMNIPQKITAEDPDEIVDTIRVLITTSSTCFDDITLDELPTDASCIPLSFVTPNSNNSGLTDRSGSTLDAKPKAVNILLEDRNPKMIQLSPSRPAAPPRNVWGVMDLKIQTFPQL